ncbi:hypothetical protein B0T24DRAFT_681700 [Lasiosphaeria ovina]|uniref:Rhodopsin domain-containing protein n=1 Tax=Lasiosphaeria ovina TaxID=92902 RepID=A0AAE0N4C5_9PEZI|nr:hypothetical protein B0T24DRAFT_681700 [Lasiosphaeria ovina]
MAFNVFDDGADGATFVLCIVLTPICIGLTSLRFIMAWRRGRPIRLEDWLALAALFFYLLWVIFALAAVIIENGRSVLQLGQLPPDITRGILISGYVVNTMYVPQQTTAKLSLLVLYHRHFSVDQTFNRLAWAVGIVQVLWAIPSWAIRWANCSPPQKLWYPKTPGSCINSQVLVAAGEPINALIDFIMVGMAIYIVRQLKIKRADKWKLGILFSLGSVSAVVGIIRIGVAYGKIEINNIDLTWLIAQMGTSCICCSVPIYRGLMPQFVKDFFSLITIPSTLFSRSGSTPKNSGKGVGDNPPTIGQNPSRRNLRGRDDWVNLDETGPSQKWETASWQERESARSGSQEGLTVPMKPAKVHRIGDIV